MARAAWLLLLLLAGCPVQDGIDSPVGRWRIQATGVELDLRPDGTFAYRSPALEFAGRFILDGSGIRLQPDQRDLPGIRLVQEDGLIRDPADPDPRHAFRRR